MGIVGWLQCCFWVVYGTVLVRSWVVSGSFLGRLRDVSGSIPDSVASRRVAWRGAMQLRRYTVQRAAITTMQAVFRGHVARSHGELIPHLARVKSARAAAALGIVPPPAAMPLGVEAAAVKIEAMFRGHVARASTAAAAGGP